MMLSFSVILYLYDYGLDHQTMWGVEENIKISSLEFLWLNDTTLNDFDKLQNQIQTESESIYLS